MKPEPSRVLEAVVQALGSQVLPELQRPFTVQSAGISMSLLYILAQESDRLIDRLLVETAAVRAILRDSAPLLAANRSLAERATELAVEVSPANYRLSTVQAQNDEVRRALIDVHAAIEALDTAEARAMNDRIWSELRESTQRRQVESGR